MVVMVPDDKRTLELERLVSRMRADGTVPREAVVQAAGRCGVKPRQVYRWLAQLKAQAKAAGKAVEDMFVDGSTARRQRVRGSRRARPLTRKGFEPKRAHLVQVGASGSILGGYRSLGGQPALGVSPSTFHRAVKSVWAQQQAAVTGGGMPAVPATQLYLKFDRMQLRCNERWELDSQLVPVALAPERGDKVLHMWQTSLIEVRHALLIGTVLHLQAPNADLLGALITASIWGRYLSHPVTGEPVFIGGYPDEIVFDRARANLNEHMDALATDMRSLFVATRGYRPWEKPYIESWHNTSQRVEYSTWPGYDLRLRDIDSQPYKPRRGETLLTFEHAAAKAAVWSLCDYNNRFHSRLGMTPLQSWISEVAP